MISAEHISVSFGARPLFSDASFVINAKERLALVGKNGAGKSTLLKILAGEQMPTSGTVSRQSELTIGYLPQVMRLADSTTLMEEADKIRKELASHADELFELKCLKDEIDMEADREKIKSSLIKTKRAFDIVGSLACIVIGSPIMLIFALIIKLTSPGPLIFKQERVGLHNRPFMMYKFRSMVVQEESKEKKAWTVRDDPRVTPVGRFMRKTSIDELPQLFNVLKGEMSLVGPRPERPFFVEKFQEEIPRYMVKHQVRPGMTGWAQVNGYRGDTSIRKRIDCDLYYIENWSLGLDIKILFLTVFKGFVNKNAY